MDNRLVKPGQTRNNRQIVVTLMTVWTWKSWTTSSLFAYLKSVQLWESVTCRLAVLHLCSL